jgi:hypothetical protein
MALTVFFLVYAGVTQAFEGVVDYYVAIHGNDNNSGRTINTPFRTIQKAANLVDAGGTVFIMGGEYNESIDIKHSGKKDKIISFKPYDNQEVTINGKHSEPSNKYTYGIINIDEKQYISIYGLNIKNSSKAGIYVTKSKNINIMNNYTLETFSSGIGIWYSEHIKVGYNEVELACHGGEEESISIADTKYSEIFHNEIYSNGKNEGEDTLGGEGIDIKDGSQRIDVHHNIVHDLVERTGIYIDGWANETGLIKVHHNTVYNCKNAGLAVAVERGGPLNNISIYDNIIYENSDAGILLGGWISHIEGENDPVTTPVTNVRIFNNTIYGNAEQCIYIDNKDIKDVTIRNNICSNDLQQEIGFSDFVDITELKIDHNIFHGQVINNSIRIYDNSSNNPLLFSPDDGRFYLQESSPAINSGSQIGAPESDFEGERWGGNIEIGAFAW